MHGYLLLLFIDQLQHQAHFQASRINLYFTVIFITGSKSCRWCDYCESYLTLSKKKTPQEDFYLRQHQGVPENGCLFAARDSLDLP